MAILSKLGIAPWRHQDAGLAGVERELHLMGYELVAAGAGTALALLKRNYSASETAAYIAIVTLALDIRRASEKGSLDTVIADKQGSAILTTMKTRYARSTIRRRVWESFSAAITSITTGKHEAATNIQQLPRDPGGGLPGSAGKRLARHWLDEIQA